MNYVYVVQIMSRDEYKDDTDYRPFKNYWVAVEAALTEARETGRDMRVVKRRITPEDVQVFEIGGVAR